MRSVINTEIGTFTYLNELDTIIIIDKIKRMNNHNNNKKINEIISQFFV